MAAIAAYLLGSFPSAYLLTKMFSGLDIRYTGSGNVGGMNTVRSAGLLPGLATIILDTGKGALATGLAGYYGNELAALAATFFVILGHNFNVWLGFKGGKGLATALGVFLVLSPGTVLYVLPVMAGLALFLRDTNTGAGLGVLALPAAVCLQGWGWPGVLAASSMVLLIILKHLPDFKAYQAGRRKLF